MTIFDILNLIGELAIFLFGMTIMGDWLEKRSAVHLSFNINRKRFVFSDIISNCERISDHCSNVAVCVTQLDKDNYSGHEYLNVKHSSEDYKEKVKEYSLKYSI